MHTIGLWHIDESGPARLQGAEVAVERDLEAWIERDPALLERGLVIVGRQIRLESGPLDLLALDPQGRWVLIEIKRERLRREVLTQAIDYAACLDSAEPAWLREQCDAYLRQHGSASTLTALLDQRGRSLGGHDADREIVIYLVGTGIDAGLERMVAYMTSRAELAIRLVTFLPFQNPHGGLLLAREIHESDDQSPLASRPSASAPAAEEILRLGDENGVGTVMRTMHQAALDAGLHVRPWATSIMYAPQEAKKRCLFTVWAGRRPQTPGVARAYIAPETFEQYFGIRETDLVAEIGQTGYFTLDAAVAESVARGIRKLLAKED
jgi:Holliday junction resolvase-like predicted endonuclease